MSGAAFDAIAARYDDDFTDRRLGRMLRDQVCDTLRRTFARDQRVLDLGCGTGEDAVWLARRGLRVTAVDASPAMLDVARGKALRGGVAESVDCREADLSSEPLTAFSGAAESSFDGAYSNFGALNCVPDLRALGAELGRLVRPGGHLLLVVMGPFCAWELVGHLLRGRPGHAFRRLRRRPRAELGRGVRFDIRYRSVGRLRRELAPWFHLREARALGLLLPPSEFRDLVDRWPRLFDRLAAVDRSVARTRPATWLSDHHLTIFERH